MKTTMSLNESDLAEIITEHFKGKGKIVKQVSFDVQSSTDCFDRPTGGHSVSVEVEITESSASQR